MGISDIATAFGAFILLVGIIAGVVVTLRHVSSDNARSREIERLGRNLDRALRVKMDHENEFQGILAKFVKASRGPIQVISLDQGKHWYYRDRDGCPVLVDDTMLADMMLHVLNPGYGRPGNDIISSIPIHDPAVPDQPAAVPVSASTQDRGGG